MPDRSFDVSSRARGPDAEFNRLRWRCRRGMKELDVLLQRYLQHDWPGAPERERAVFLRLLELPDPELAAYCLGRAVPEDREFQALVGRLTDGRNARVDAAARP